MANGIDVKMGVSGLSQFRQAMNQGQQSVKTFEAALKLNEKQLKATGDREIYMQQKSKLLQQQINAQNSVIKAAEQALAAMTKNGVDPSSKAYQQMQQRLLTARSALLDMHGELTAVGQEAQEASRRADQLSDSLSGVNSLSFEGVLNGIGKITDGMAAAGRRITELMRDVWDSVTMAASWADNENTLAAMYGIDVETLQRMQGASRTIDTSVEAIIKSRQRLKQNMVSETQEIADSFIKLGVDTGRLGGQLRERRDFRDWEDVFWDVGDALLHYNDEVERDVLAQQLLGRSWMELMPLFKAGREEYENTLADQSIVTQENVDKLNALDDALQKLDQDYQATKNTILAELAPAFTMVGSTVSDLIRQFNEYLQTAEGQEKLAAMGEAVTNLFSGLSDVDFGVAVDTATNILTGVTDALQWIVDNKDSVVTAIEAIGGVFLGLEAAKGLGTLAELVITLRNLVNGESGAGGTGIGGSLASIAASLATIAPYAAGLAALLTPAGTATDDWDVLYDKQGNVTAAGRAEGLPATAEEYGALSNAQLELLVSEQVQKKMMNALSGYMYWLSGADFFDYTKDEIRQRGTANKGFTEDQLALLTSLYDAMDQLTAGMNKNDIPNAIDIPSFMLEYGVRVTEEGLVVETTPTLPDDAASSLQQALDAMALSVPVVPDLSSVAVGHANGLPFVPFDGYIAALHKGERVVPANQNSTYTANSNLYVESMYMNSGTDAQALAAAMAAENRRIRAGFGS